MPHSACRAERREFPHWSEKLTMTLLLIGVSSFAFVRLAFHHASTGPADALSLATPMDALVPFVPVFAFAYVLYYPFMLLPLPILRRRADFYRGLLAFLLMQVAAFFAFLVFPTRIIRPSAIPADLAGDVLRWVYSVDPGWNLLPSLHVGHSVLVALLHWRHARSRVLMAASVAALITASTVLIKQHYLVDIPAGALLAFICYRAAHLQLPVLGRQREPGFRPADQ